MRVLQCIACETNGDKLGDRTGSLWSLHGCAYACLVMGQGTTKVQTFFALIFTLASTILHVLYSHQEATWS